MIVSRRVYVTVRNFLFSKANKEFLIFLFFLGLSGIFWLLMTLNETYEREVAIPIHIDDIPADIMLTSDETDTVKVVIRDRGIVLITYLYGEKLKHINAGFKNYEQGNGTGIITANDVTKLIQQRMAGSSKVVSVKPDKLKFFYNTGTCKRIPVQWKGRATPDHLYFVSQFSYSPDSVTIYASEDKLDSVQIAYSEPINYNGFRDTLQVECKVRKIEGVKMVPDHFTTTFYTDVLTEAITKDIPIRGINMPKDKVLRTFPAKADVKYIAGVNVYRTITPNDFRIVVDYENIKNTPSEKCTLQLDEAPQGIKRVTLIPQQVDYLIEDE